MTYKTDEVGTDLSIMGVIKVAMDAGNRVSVYAAGDGSASVTIEKPEPRSVAHWVRERGRVRHWHCSACGYVTGLAGLTYKFCPECGAELEERHYEID